MTTNPMTEGNDEVGRLLQGTTPQAQVAPPVSLPSATARPPEPPHYHHHIGISSPYHLQYPYYVSPYPYYPPYSYNAATAQSDHPYYPTPTSDPCVLLRSPVKTPSANTADVATSKTKKVSKKTRRNTISERQHGNVATAQSYHPYYLMPTSVPGVFLRPGATAADIAAVKKIDPQFDPTPILAREKAAKKAEARIAREKAERCDAKHCKKLAKKDGMCMVHYDLENMTYEQKQDANGVVVTWDPITHSKLPGFPSAVRKCMINGMSSRLIYYSARIEAYPNHPLVLTTKSARDKDTLLKTLIAEVKDVRDVWLSERRVGHYPRPGDKLVSVPISGAVAATANLFHLLGVPDAKEKVAEGEEEARLAIIRGELSVHI